MIKNLSFLIIVAYGAAVVAAFFVRPDVYKGLGKRVFIYDTASLRTSIINNIKKQFSEKDTVAINFEAELDCGTHTDEEKAARAKEMENFPVRFTDRRLMDSFYRKELSKKLGVFVITSNDLFWLRISQGVNKYGYHNDSLMLKYIDSLNANILFLTFDATALGSKNVVVTEKYKIGKSLTEMSKNFKYKGAKWLVSK